ncbi:hypothetical protein BYT27DRAFT_6684569 [Phlegmacium glaucopus]|nr:hypothetical protein BYT27DRAFT_6684569 [Phlegmacium glaucopus]
MNLETCHYKMWTANAEEKFELVHATCICHDSLHRQVWLGIKKSQRAYHKREDERFVKRYEAMKYARWSRDR